MSHPIVSIVIPTCHRSSLLGSCLDCLTPERQGWRLWSDTLDSNESNYEVIVTDDGNDEPTRNLLASNYPWVRYVKGPSRGPAANRNSGARFASGDWLLFCDDDCLPASDLLKAYARAQRAHPGCEVFEGRTKADREKRHPLEESPINSKGGNLWSCNFAIRRERFEEAGGFDETFPFAAVEDMEFRVRLEKAGVPMVFVEDAVVVHPWRRLSVPSYLKQQARHRKSHLLMMSLHPDYRSYFTAWNVVKDVLRYYAMNFLRDLKAFGGTALLFQPLFLWCQFSRIVTYKFGRC